MKIHFHYNQILFHFHRHSWIIQIWEKPPVGCSLAEVNTHTSQVKVLQRKKRPNSHSRPFSLVQKSTLIKVAQVWKACGIWRDRTTKDASERLRHLNYLSDPMNLGIPIPPKLFMLKSGWSRYCKWGIVVGVLALWSALRLRWSGTIS